MFSKSTQLNALILGVKMCVASSLIASEQNGSYFLNYADPFYICFIISIFRYILRLKKNIGTPHFHQYIE